MTITTTQEAQPDEHGSLVKSFVSRTVATVLGVLFCLSIISYSQADVHVMDGGVDGQISNWVGRFGAWVARESFEWLGLAVYPAAALIILCVTVRVVGTRTRPLRGSYFAGILLSIWGCSMLFGVFPRMLSGARSYLNLPSSGGVIGQRFCAPMTGWMSYVVNPTGSVIIASTMILLGLLAVWYFDWQQRTRIWWRQIHLYMAEREAMKDSSETVDPYYVPEETVLEAEEESAPAVAAAKKRQKVKKPKTAMVKKPKTAVVPPENTTLGNGLGEDPYKNYRLPSIKLLNEVSGRSSAFDPKEVNAKKQALQQTLESFGIDAAVGDATCGPRVTLFEIRPAPGVKVEKISSLANNIKMNLKAESLRILTPIPGKDTVGIEIPNNASASVGFRDLLQSTVWRDFKGALPVCLGKDISGKPEILDLTRAPHLLIAGATGSGKSVCMNSLIMSLLYRFKPDELKMIMIDPKVVEFAGYSQLPHLVTPVINDVKKVPLALNWAVKEMERRYQMLSKVGVRNIAAFNARPPETEPTLDDDGKPIPARLPYIVVIIDELADIMMTAKQEVETLLARIAQMARAIGIHAVIATQRPSVNVITGVIKANFPTRIAFQVTSITDSRTIIDGKGAEALLGRGDMLFKPPSGSKLTRVQGCFLGDDEIERAVGFISEQAEPDFADDVFKAPDVSGKSSGSGSAGGTRGAGGGESDFSDADEELIQRAIEVIMKDRRATTSHVQRRLRIGYNRASLIIEELERRGIVGPQIGTAPRDILMETPSDDEDEDVEDVEVEIMDPEEE